MIKIPQVLPFGKKDKKVSGSRSWYISKLQRLLKKSLPAITKYLNTYNPQGRLNKIFQEEFWKDCKRVVKQIDARYPDWEKWEYVLEILGIAEEKLSEQDSASIRELVKELSHAYNTKFLEILKSRQDNPTYNEIAQEYYLEDVSSKQKDNFLEVPGSLWTLVVDVEKSTQAALQGADSEVYQKVVRAPLELHQELVKQIGRENLVMGYAGDGAIYLINYENLEQVKNVVSNYQTYLLNTPQQVYLRAGIARAQTLKRNLDRFFRITLIQESLSPSLESIASEGNSFLGEAMELLKETQKQQSLDIILPNTQVQWEPDFSLVSCPFETIRPLKGYAFMAIMIKMKRRPNTEEVLQLHKFLDYMHDLSKNPLQANISVKPTQDSEVQIVLNNNNKDRWMPVNLGRYFLENSLKSQAQRRIDNLKLLEADTRLVQFPIDKMFKVIERLEPLEQGDLLSFGIAMSTDPLEFACSFAGEEEMHHVSGRAWMRVGPGLEKSKQVGIFHAAAVQLKTTDKQERQSLRKDQWQSVKGA